MRWEVTWEERLQEGRPHQVGPWRSPKGTEMEEPAVWRMAIGGGNQRNWEQGGASAGPCAATALAWQGLWGD